MNGSTLKGWLDVISKYRPDLAPYAGIYRNIHQYPELSCQEENTAKLAAEHLKKVGYEVVDKIGGHGVVGVLHNGEGQTVLLRADMDALPVLEETGLSYASKVLMKDVLNDSDSVEKPVMHACGHDMHVTALMAAATTLAAAREHWSGTVICLFQPAEEGGGGAYLMVHDKLYQNIPRPDLLLAQHVAPRRAGTLALRSGPALSASDTWQVRVYGKGGHGSSPHKCVDPILLGAHILVRLQSIISREVDPESVAVLTCGSFHGGEKDNIVPDYTDMTLNLRTYDPDTRVKVLESMKHVIISESEASGSPNPPRIEEVETLPPVINNAELTDQLRSTFEEAYGTGVQLMRRNMASEDFPYLADGNIPYVYWNLGCIDHKIWDDAESKGELEKIPGNHNGKFAPAIFPTLERGTDALVLAALNFL